jgi:enoyl-[acyl-carrier-protein] reductase (NADH)
MVSDIAASLTGEVLVVDGGILNVTAMPS